MEIRKLNISWDATIFSNSNHCMFGDFELGFPKEKVWAVVKKEHLHFSAVRFCNCRHGRAGGCPGLLLCKGCHRCLSLQNHQLQRRLHPAHQSRQEPRACPCLLHLPLQLTQQVPTHHLTGTNKSKKSNFFCSNLFFLSRRAFHILQRGCMHTMAAIRYHRNELLKVKSVQEHIQSP